MAKHERGFDFGEARMKERQAIAAQRLLQAREAHDNLGTFIKHTMPDPRNPDDPERSLYKPSRVHELFCRTMEAVEAGKYKRLIVTVPPRHGKTEHFSLRGSAWFLGRNPTKNVILATYNQDLADQHGEKVRELIASPAFNQVFPDVRLTKGVRSKRRIGVDVYGNVATADRTTYATETTSAVTGANLSQSRHGLAAAGNSEKGFFSGGYNGVSDFTTADRATYSTETTSAVTGANLSVARRAFVAA